MTSHSTKIDDDALLARSRALAKQIAEAEAELIAVVAEIERRALYRREACTSINQYCIDELDMPPSVAYARVAVARLSLRITDVLAWLTAPKERRIRLTGLAKLAPHLTTDNAADLLSRAAGRSTRQIQVLIASLATYQPRPSAAKSATAKSEPAAASVPRQTDASLTICFTADPALRADIERVRCLLRAEIPDGNLAAIFAWALRAAIEAVEGRAVDDATFLTKELATESSDAAPGTNPRQPARPAYTHRFSADSVDSREGNL